MSSPAEIVFLLEEKSARALLERVLDRISARISARYIVFEGKQDLQKHLEKKLKHYQNPNAIFLVMQDQDLDDCKELKQNLWEKVKQSGKAEQTSIRISCHELESFYLGDLAAVGKALNLKLPSQESQKFRNPDTINNPAQLLKQITKYRYSKIAGSRAIADYLNLTGQNRSASFRVLIESLRRLSHMVHQ